MKAFLKYIFIIALVLTPGELIAKQQTRLVRVGIFHNAPVVFEDQSNRPEGIYPDILDAIAQEEGWELEYVLDTWNNNLNKLYAGKIDLMTSIAVTEERSRLIDYSQENILTMWGQVYVAKGATITNLFGLEGQQVAILAGGINGANFKKYCSSFDVACEFIEKDTYDEVAASIESGEVAAGVTNNMKGIHFESVYEIEKSPIMFNPFPLLFATPKGHGEILKTIDKHLASWKQDKGSIYYEIIDKWTQAPTTDSLPRWVYIAMFMGVVTILSIAAFIGHILARNQRG